MSATIRLVQGDTRPPVIAQLTTDRGVTPLDISGATTVLKFRKRGSAAVKATITGTKLTGFRRPDGTIDTTAPYDVAGKGGRVQFNWGANDLDTAGKFEGEIQVTFGDSSVQSVPEVIEFDVRDDF